ncbi:MAG: hypothetical protein KC729_08720, partial [Candidatus Eisenbacteria bacterium]|nr:hypothetical protein [Candidatus Eisenbacteria bacterium]
MTVVRFVSRLVPFAFLLTCSLVKADEFQWRNATPQGNALWGVAFESTSTGYAVGARGTVLRTTDGGTTWTDLSDRDAVDETLREVEVIAPGTLVAVTEPGRILRSTDAGGTWVEIAHPGTESLREMNQVDGVLTVLGQLSEVLRSSDGGVTWTTLTSPGSTGLKGQYWFDPDHGIVVGNNLARETFNGGLTWSDLPDVGGATVSCEAIDFLADEGILVGEFSRWRTHDGGASWSQEAGFEDPIYQRRVFLESASTYLVFVDTEGAAIARTTDDGETWEYPVLRRDIAGFLDAIRRPGGGFLTVSSDGDLFRSDDGLAWINATHAPDDGTRFIVDALGDRPDGTVFASGYATSGSEKRWLRSDDLGETWAVDGNEPPSDWIMAIHFRDDAFGLAAGYKSGGGVHVDRTTDGGATWSSHALTSSSGFVTDLAMVGDDMVLASVVRESSGTVERSTDGGVTWSSLPVGAERMECVASAGGNVVYAGGGSTFSASLWRSDDAGATWHQPAGTGLPGRMIFGMDWIDSETGVVAAESLYRTTDGGETWVQVDTAQARELDASGFAFAAGGYLAGSTRVSSDGGLTWSAPRVPMQVGPRAILVHGDRVIVGAGGSSILTGVVPEVVGVADPEPDVDSEVAVFAQTMAGQVRIRLDLATPGRVEVTVHDIHGRLVRTLGETYLDAGTHELRWDGRSSRGRTAASA